MRKGKLKKITIVTPTLSGGGAEKIAVNLANYYFFMGFIVDVVVFDGNGVYRKHLIDGVNLVDFKAHRARYAFFDLRKYFKNNDSCAYLSVIREANIMLALASLGLKMPKVVFREANTLHAVRSLSFLKRIVFKFLMSFSYRRANKIIANSDDTKLDLISEINVGSSLVDVVPNPVLPTDFEDLLKKSIEHEWFLDSNVQVVISVGRLHYQKNFEFLIDSFKEVYKKKKNARLLIVGEGEEKDKLFNKIRALGLESVANIISFKDNIYPYYENSSVFALASRWEGFGNVLVEALSAGLPIVSINCPGGPKMILRNGEFGNLVPEGDIEKYTSALLNALENDQKSEASKVYAKEFTVSSVAKKYLEIISI